MITVAVMTGFIVGFVVGRILVALKRIDACFPNYHKND
jgi:hypothetical protein